MSEDDKRDDLAPPTKPFEFEKGVNVQVQKEQFARLVSAGVLPKDAAREVRPESRRPDKIAERYKRDPYVKRRIGEILDEAYPVRHSHLVDLLKRQYELAILGASVKDINDSIRLRVEIEGLKPAEKSARINVTVPAKLGLDGMPQLPGVLEDED